MQIVGVAMRMFGGDTVISAPAPERHVHLIHGLADPLDWEQGFITSCRGYLRSRTLQDGLSFKQRTCLGEMVIKYSIDPEIVIQEGTKPQPATPRDYSDLDDDIPF